MSVRSSIEGFSGTERYEVEGLLGAGACGVVYRVLDRERDRHLALKLLRAYDGATLYRFKREFRALVDIRHENLVRLHELSHHDGRWFFTMEYVAGISFSDAVRTTSPEMAGFPFDMQRLRDGLAGLVNGIQAVHDAGRLHRDLKPSNVLITPEGRVVVLDFGLVTELAPSGQAPTTDVQGTLAYMSPEQARGQVMTPATDWYSVGVMLYEAITGRLPFEGPPMKVLYDKTHTDPTQPQTILPDLPENLNRLCMALLARDPEDRPSAKTILKNLKSMSWVVSTTVPRMALEHGFVGRQAELISLRRAFDLACAGKPQVVLIEGNSGVGKSALVRRFLDEISGVTPALVLEGRCYARESVPFKAFDSLIDALTRHLKRLPTSEIEALLPRDIHALVRLFPVFEFCEGVARRLRRADGNPDVKALRRQGYQALKELLGRISARHALILFVDDLQWGDEDSLLIFKELFRGSDAPPTLYIGCYRSEDAPRSALVSSLLSPIRGIATFVGFQRLQLSPLSQSDSRLLAAQLLQSAAGTVLDQIARECGGSPLLLRELIRYADAVSGQDATLVTDASVGLDALLRQRIEGLDGAARKLVEIVAIAGRPIDTRCAEVAAGIDGGGDDPWDQLRDESLVRFIHGSRTVQVDTAHDRIRDVATAELEQQVYRSHHRAIAEVLSTGNSADPELQFTHYLEAGENEAAFTHAVRAARQATDALAFAHGAELYAQALALIDASHAEWPTLLRCRGQALMDAGHSSQAAEAFLVASRAAPPEMSMMLRQMAMEQFLCAGLIDDGLSLLRELITEVGMKWPKSQWATFLRGAMHFLRRNLVGNRAPTRRRTTLSVPDKTHLAITSICASAALGLSFTDTTNAFYFHSIHFNYALKCGDDYQLQRALLHEAIFLSGISKNAKRGMRLIESAKHLASDSKDHYLEANIDYFWALYHFLNGGWKEAYRHATKGAETFRTKCSAAHWEIHNLRSIIFNSLYFQGEIARLLKLLPQQVAEAWEQGDVYAVATYLGTGYYVTLLALDRPDDARRQLEESMSSWTHEGFHLQHYLALIGHIGIDCYLRRGEEAWQRLQAHWKSVTRMFVYRFQFFRVFSLYQMAQCAMAAARDSAEPEPYLKRVRWAQRRLARFPVPWAQGFAQLFDAALAAFSGRATDAETLLNLAEAAFSQADMRLYQRTVRRQRGILIGGDRGAELVREAERWMLGQGIVSPERFTGVIAPGRWVPAE